MNLDALRNALREPIVELYDDYTEKLLHDVCATLGFKYLENGGDTKRKCMRASIDAVRDRDIPRIAENLLELHSPSA